jgi:hypothetical protein
VGPRRCGERRRPQDSIAEHTDRSHSAVNNILDEHGVRRQTSEEARRPDLAFVSGLRRTTMCPMRIWEYKVVEPTMKIRDRVEIMEREFNRAGAEGWELCSDHAGTYTFKRLRES